MRQIYLLLITLFFSQVVFAVDLVALQMQPGAVSSRFTFTLTEKTRGKVSFQTNPDRVVVDFMNTRKHFNMYNARLGGANVKSINAEQLPDDITRFTFYVDGKATWKIDMQPKDGENGVRVLLDIISVKPVTLNRQPDAALRHPERSEGSSNNLNNTFKQSVLDTFAVLSQEVKMRQQQGNDLVGRSRIDRDNEIAQKTKPATLIVVIDAGHGGHDTGAIGPSGVYEKTVVLGIAKQLAAVINQQPNMRAVLTRQGDYFVPLRKRLALARKGDADLFIAIHADSVGRSDASGASVYALSTRGATSEAARWLARRENHTELSDVELNALPDDSPMVRSVLIDLAQTVTIRDSVRFASTLLDKLDDVTTLHYKRVEQAPFVVLKSPDIPSVLIETGYISNPKEEQLLASSTYQKKMAQAILQGIMSYREKWNG